MTKLDQDIVKIKKQLIEKAKKEEYGKTLDKKKPGNQKKNI